MLTFRRIRGVLLATAALTMLAPAALAHEQRTTDDGRYTVVTGWEHEPPSVNERNAATIRITRADTTPAQAVTGAESSLRLRVRYGSQQRELPLRADSRQRPVKPWSCTQSAAPAEHPGSPNSRQVVSPRCSSTTISQKRPISPFVVVIVD